MSLSFCYTIKMVDIVRLLIKSSKCAQRLLKSDYPQSEIKKYINKKCGFSMHYSWFLECTWRWAEHLYSFCFTNIDLAECFQHNIVMSGTVGKRNLEITSPGLSFYRWKINKQMKHQGPEKETYILKIQKPSKWQLKFESEYTVFKFRILFTKSSLTLYSEI